MKKERLRIQVRALPMSFLKPKHYFESPRLKNHELDSTILSLYRLFEVIRQTLKELNIFLNRLANVVQNLQYVLEEPYSISVLSLTDLI